MGEGNHVDRRDWGGKLVVVLCICFFSVAFDVPAEQRGERCFRSCFRRFAGFATFFLAAIPFTRHGLHVFFGLLFFLCVFAMAGGATCLCGVSIVLIACFFGRGL